MKTNKTLVLVTCLVLMVSFLLTPKGSAVAVDGRVNQQPTPAPGVKAGGSSDQKFDKKDIPRAIAYMNNHEKQGLPLVGYTKKKPSKTSTPYFVQPILFVASDLVESQGNQQAIDESFQLFTRWYSGSLELNNSGYTFQVKPAVVYHAPQPFSYYKCTYHEAICDNYDGIWVNVLNQLRTNGYSIWSEGTIYITFVKGAGGWAGGAGVNPTGYSNWPAPGPASVAGAAILGDWALDAISGTVNEECYSVYYSACFPEPQRGAVAHELGHAFGLAHAMDQVGSLMYSWWDFPNNPLFNMPGNDEVSVLRNDSHFFTPHACDMAGQVRFAWMPETVVEGTRFYADFMYKNYGYCHWDPADTVLTLMNDKVWSAAVQQPLPYPVRPAQEYLFRPALTAPSLAEGFSSASYANYWQLRAAKTKIGPKVGGMIKVISRDGYPYPDPYPYPYPYPHP